MLADEYSLNKITNISSSIKPGTTTLFILGIIRKTSSHFKTTLKDPKINHPLNEDKLTQILVQQINAQLYNIAAPIVAQTQYTDLFNSIKGKPDFYFHSIEEDKISVPLFVVESKRLPSKTFETEYVIGNKQNGGIERYKIEKHGFGLTESGMIGFVESIDYSFWLVKINLWIEGLSKSNKEWNVSEQLKKIETSLEYSYLESKVIRTKSEPLKLYHFWIDIQ